MNKRIKFHGKINSFLVNPPILHPLKTPENHKVTLARNGLIYFNYLLRDFEKTAKTFLFNFHGFAVFFFFEQVNTH